MTDLLFSSFPASAASRSLFLGQIEFQVKKSEVASLLVDVGISHNDFKLYWDTRRPRHRGSCWVKFRTRELAVLAWSRLNGLPKWGRVLVVRPMTKPGALKPSRDELEAARQQQPTSSASPPRQAPSLPPKAQTPPVSDPNDAPGRQEPWADLEEFYPNAIKMLRAQGIDYKPGGRSGDAAEDSSTNADNTSPSPGPKPNPPAGKDIWSDGSLLETIQANAGEVALGWGGYGSFQANPLRGPIDPSEVQALNWHDPTPFRFVTDEGKVALELPPFPEDWKKGPGERTESLWFVLAKASGDMTDEELREKEKTLPLPRDVGL